MGLPRILRASSQNDPVYAGGPDGIPLPVPEELPQPRVAMMWVPQSFGSPNIAGNQPADYWPGGKYVDWVGIDIYSKFAGAFDDGKAFFERYDRWPFVIGEYGPWDNDYGGGFTDELLRWAERHDRVKMVLYYRGVDPDNELQPPALPRRPAGPAPPPEQAALGRVRAGGHRAHRPAAARRAPSP